MMKFIPFIAFISLRFGLNLPRFSNTEKVSRFYCRLTRNAQRTTWSAFLENTYFIN